MRLTRAPRSEWTKPQCRIVVCEIQVHLKVSRLCSCRRVTIKFCLKLARGCSASVVAKLLAVVTRQPFLVSNNPVSRSCTGKLAPLPTTTTWPCAMRSRNEIVRQLCSKSERKDGGLEGGPLRCTLGCTVDVQRAHLVAPLAKLTNTHFPDLLAPLLIYTCQCEPHHSMERKYR